MNKQELAEKLKNAHGYFTLEFYKNKIGEVAKIFSAWITPDKSQHRITYIVESEGREGGS